jgi:hypothetical protein
MDSKQTYLLQTKYCQIALLCVNDDSVHARLNLKANQYTEESPAQNKSLYIEVYKIKTRNNNTMYFTVNWAALPVL